MVRIDENQEAIALIRMASDNKARTSQAQAGVEDCGADIPSHLGAISLLCGSKLSILRLQMSVLRLHMSPVLRFHMSLLRPQNAEPQFNTLRNSAQNPFSLGLNA